MPAALPPAASSCRLWRDRRHETPSADDQPGRGYVGREQLPALTAEASRHTPRTAQPGRQLAASKAAMIAANANRPDSSAGRAGSPPSSTASAANATPSSPLRAVNRRHQPAELVRHVGRELGDAYADMAAGMVAEEMRGYWPRSPRSGTATATAVPATSGRLPRERRTKKRSAVSHHAGRRVVRERHAVLVLTWRITGQFVAHGLAAGRSGAPWTVIRALARIEESGSRPGTRPGPGAERLAQ